jgi:hypothetical protein
MWIRCGLGIGIDAGGSLVAVPPLGVVTQFKRVISAISAPFGLKPRDSSSPMSVR